MVVREDECRMGWDGLFVTPLPKILVYIVTSLCHFTLNGWVAICLALRFSLRIVAEARPVVNVDVEAIGDRVHLDHVVPCILEGGVHAGVDGVPLARYVK